MKLLPELNVIIEAKSFIVYLLEFETSSARKKNEDKNMFIVYLLEFETSVLLVSNKTETSFIVYLLEFETDPQRKMLKEAVDVHSLPIRV